MSLRMDPFMRGCAEDGTPAEANTARLAEADNHLSTSGWHSSTSLSVSDRWRLRLCTEVRAALTVLQTHVEEERRRLRRASSVLLLRSFTCARNLTSSRRS